MAGLFDFKGKEREAEEKKEAEAKAAIEEELISLTENLADMRKQALAVTEEEKKLRCGSSFPTSLPDGDYRVYSESGAFLMLGRAEDGRMHTVKSFFEV